MAFSARDDLRHASALLSVPRHASAFKACVFPPHRLTSIGSGTYNPPSSVVAVAQLVESRIVIPAVVGSSPIGHPTTIRVRIGLMFYTMYRSHD